MGDIPHYFDIILFAMVAAFLVLRLRSVLGRRTGNERRRDPSYLSGPAPAGDKVVPLTTPPNAAPPVARSRFRQTRSPTDWRRLPLSIRASMRRGFSTAPALPSS
jgi:hypothetical protein